MRHTKCVYVHMHTAPVSVYLSVRYAKQAGVKYIHWGGADPERHFHLNIKKTRSSSRAAWMESKKGSEKWRPFFPAHEKVICTNGISSHLCAVRKKNTLRSGGERNEWRVFCLFDTAVLSLNSCGKTPVVRVIYEIPLFSLILIFFLRNFCCIKLPSAVINLVVRSSSVLQFLSACSS